MQPSLMPGKARRLGVIEMDIRYVDEDTLAIAQLVAESEGISLQEAISDQLELFGGVS